MLYLSFCALNSVKPDALYIEKLDLDKLYDECQRHSITALVCYALESVIELPHKWHEAKGKAIRKNMLFDVERQHITDFMNKNGIKYMPLKGILLKEYYPKIGMREMSDNDIFYDVSFREELKAFMLSLSYECVLTADDHDIYEKEPVYNFEMHHSFFLKEVSKALYEYYRDIEKRMIKDDNNACGYYLSNEDLYIYLIAHEYKHYMHSGTGIRSFLDCYVFLKKHSDTLDWDYINRETVKAGIDDFEKKQRDLYEKFKVSFVDADLKQEEIDFLEYLNVGGVHGNFSVSVLNEARGTVLKNDKLTFSKRVKYIFKRLFPPMSLYKMHYPFFYKHKLLLPFCFFYRLYLAIFKRNKKIKNEMRILFK